MTVTGLGVILASTAVWFLLMLFKKIKKTKKPETADGKRLQLIEGTFIIYKGWYE